VNPEMKKKLDLLARRNEKLRQDPRFLNVMGFLVAKGLLGYNRPITPKPNAKIEVRDAVWAGTHIEPRILEVLPAAFIRFERHFQIRKNPDQDERRLLEIRRAIQGKMEEVPPFAEIPFKKFGIWLDFALSDKRTVPVSERKRLKSFRLRPDAIERLTAIAARRKMSEADILEELIGKLA